MGERETPQAGKPAAMYTIHLDGWKIVAVIRKSASEHWVDVEAIHNRVMARPIDPRDKLQ